MPKLKSIVGIHYYTVYYSNTILCMVCYTLFLQQWPYKCSFDFIITLSISLYPALYNIYKSEHFPIEWIRIFRTTRRDLPCLYTYE